MLYRIEALHFVAGLEIDNIICIKAAPILKRLIGHSLCYIQDVVAENCWKIEEVR